MIDLPVHLEPKDFDWHRVYGHEEFLDEVLEKHSWRVLELLFALEYQEEIDSEELDQEGLWEVIMEEQESASGEPDHAHPAMVFAEVIPEGYFLATRLLQESGQAIQEGSPQPSLADDTWQLCAQLSMLQLPLVGYGSLIWEERVDIFADLAVAAEVIPPSIVKSATDAPASSPGAARWTSLREAAPALGETFMRLEDLRAAYEAFVSIGALDPSVEELALGLFRSCISANGAVLRYCFPPNGE